MLADVTGSEPSVSGRTPAKAAPNAWVLAMTVLSIIGLLAIVMIAPQPDGARWFVGCALAAIAATGSWLLFRHWRANDIGFDDISAGLVEIAQALGATIGDHDRLADRLTAETRRLLGVDWVLYYCWSSELQKFELASTSGVADGLREQVAAIGVDVFLTQEVTEQLAATGAVEVTRADRQPQIPAAVLDRWNVKVVRVQKVALDGRPIGLLAGISTRSGAPFSARQRRLHAAIASEAGAALASSLLVESVRQAERAKGEFVATLSHELRTPLSVIVGYTDLILDAVFGQPSAAEVKALHRIRHQSMQLLDLIQGVLDLNRLDARGLSISLQDVTVEQLLREVREDIPEAWARPGVRLDWKGTDIQASLRSDRAKVESILRNLIHNALKYTERGSVTVGAALAAAGSMVEFTVTDTGAGIAAADLPHIFDMFAQGSSGPRGGGVGLGLYIVKRLTEALGGTIRVDSQQGFGTKFVLTLPLAWRQKSAAA